MIELDLSKISNLCADVSEREPAFKVGDKVCWCERPDVYIGSISPDSFIGAFTGRYAIFASDQFFEHFAPNGGANTIHVWEEDLTYYKDNENC